MKLERVEREALDAKNNIREKVDRGDLDPVEAQWRINQIDLRLSYWRSLKSHE